MKCKSITEMSLKELEDWKAELIKEMGIAHENSFEVIYCRNMISLLNEAIQERAEINSKMFGG